MLDILLLEPAGPLLPPMEPCRFCNVMFEPAGVLLLPDVIEDVNTLPERLLKRMLRTNIWYEYQTGKITSEEAVRELAFKYAATGLTKSTIRRCLLERTMRPVPSMLKLLDMLKIESGLRLFCVSNTSKEQQQRLQDEFPAVFSMFEASFTSAEEGVRKPALGFFELVLAKARIKAEETLFVDCDLESVVAARSLGMGGVVVAEDDDECPLEESTAVKRIMCQLRDRRAILASAEHFLLRLGFRHPSLTSDGIRIQDNFAQFLMADLLNDPRFLPMDSPPPSRLIKFMNMTALLSGMDHYSSDACTFTDIPDDLDSTSLGLSVLHKFGKVDLIAIHNVLDQMLQFVSKDNILQVYFDHERPRVDPVVATNVIFLFHLANRGNDVEGSERFVHSVLLHRAYLDGTLYYNLAEAFLFCVARLVHKFKDHFATNGMRSLLAGRLEERTGMGGDALTLAMRIVACTMSGIQVDRRDEQLLMQLQNLNGSWDCHPFYRYGSNAKSWIGNEALTTAYAITALQRDLAPGYSNATSSSGFSIV